MNGYTYPLYTDLITRPHLLVAGSTGCGKSTFIDGLMNSIMYQNPAPLLFLVDPKQIDLLKYSTSRLTARYESDPAGALALLRQVSNLIDARYSELRPRILAGELINKSDRPPVYVIVDEFADLTGRHNPDKKQASDIMQLMIHISAIGRAANVHLICATQTVLARIIPTEFTNNMIVVALHCRTDNQSRVLIGESGAELLPLHGKCIINYGNKLQVAECPPVPADYLTAIMKYWQHPQPRELVGLSGSDCNVYAGG